MGIVKDIINNINPVSFNYKSQPNHESYGMIAEELVDVLPNLVVMKNSAPETIQYHRLFPFLIKALQECYSKIERLENLHL